MFISAHSFLLLQLSHIIKYNDVEGQSDVHFITFNPHLSLDKL